MNKFPNFVSYGYQAVKELGCNRAGFRTTYKAGSLSSGHEVVVKHFESTPKNPDEWNALDRMYTEEIQALSRLRHPNIPYFIESFQMEDKSRCIVLEYKNGQTLAEPQSFSTDEINLITVSLLEVLVYLQNQVPSIKHRDIKPENVLVEGSGDQLKVYLVDFGFARIGDGEARTVSSMIKGTLGFMAPEQRRNQPLNNASDLYSLGATLICLITGIKSHEIDELTDDYNKINFRNKVNSNIDKNFVKWLGKMVEPQSSNRFSNAKIALDNLNELRVRSIKNNSDSSQKDSPSGTEDLFSTNIFILASTFSIFSVVITFNIIGGDRNNVLTERQDKPEQAMSKSENITAPPSSSVDTSQLENFLNLRQWKEANAETWRLLLLMGGNPTGISDYKEANMDNNDLSRELLDSSEIEKIPCEDLMKIDRLWTNVSDGNFGFSRWKDVYINAGGDPINVMPNPPPFVEERASWIKIFQTTHWKDFRRLVNVKGDPQDFLYGVANNRVSTSVVAQLPYPGNWWGQDSLMRFRGSGNHPYETAASLVFLLSRKISVCSK